MKTTGHRPTAKEIVKIIRESDESQIGKLPMLIEAHALSFASEKNKELTAEIERFKNV